MATTAPLIESLLAHFEVWRRKHNDVRRSLDELGRCGDHEVARMAKDVQLTPDELVHMAHFRSDAADLLLRRMAALHLESEALLRKAPDVMRDLQRACSVCKTKRRCLKELTEDPENPAWRQHCPNENTLAALEAEFAVKH